MPRIGSDAAKSIGEQLVAARQAIGATRLDLAYHARVDPTALGRYETGKAIPNLATLVRLAETLGIDPGELIQGLRWVQFPQDHESPQPLSDVLPKRRKAS